MGDGGGDKNRMIITRYYINILTWYHIIIRMAFSWRSVIPLRD